MTVSGIARMDEHLHHIMWTTSTFHVVEMFVTVNGIARTYEHLHRIMGVLAIVLECMKRGLKVNETLYVSKVLEWIQQAEKPALLGVID